MGPIGRTVTAAHRTGIEVGTESALPHLSEQSRKLYSKKTKGYTIEIRTL